VDNTLPYLEIFYNQNLKSTDEITEDLNLLIIVFINNFVNFFNNHD